MAYAPAAPIEKTAPTPNLLTVSRPIPGTRTGDTPALNWRDGITWQSTDGDCQRGYTWPNCQTDPLLFKCAATDHTAVRTDPFVIYVPAECDWTIHPDEVRARARNELDAATPGQIARALWTGTTDAGPIVESQSLMACGTDISAAAGAVDPTTAVATLISNYEQCASANGRPTLHVPAALLPWLLDSYVVRQEGDTYRGPSGSLVSAGPNYPSDGAFGPGGAIAAAGQAWMYVTGPVEYALGDPIIFPEDDAMARADQRMNRFEVWAERQALVRFNCCCVFAVLTRQPSPS